MKAIYLAIVMLSIVFTVFGKTSDQEKLELIKQHKTAVHIKDGWIRDPYIIIGPDGNYYLTGTTANPNDPREISDPYNIGLGNESVVGSAVRVWRSADLVNWEYLGEPYTIEHNSTPETKTIGKPLLWAPELHWLGDRWALVHCPQRHSILALSDGKELTTKWTHPSPETFVGRHDPSLFKDDDGIWYLLYGNTLIAPLNDDFTGFTADPVRIDPSDRLIGHEGATMRKIGDKYVHIGTAWSADKGRTGSYNLYYCTADKITGPYSERRFLGRFLGHGTPFQDKEGNWWCTAFFNSNVPPLDTDGIETRDLSETAQTINKLGTTIVPLEVNTLKNGDIYIRAKDPHYRNPGPDEGKFTNTDSGYKGVKLKN